MDNQKDRANSFSAFMHHYRERGNLDLPENEFTPFVVYEREWSKPKEDFHPV